MHVVVTILTLAGALGVFLFGMKIMSEALQKVAGSRLKSLLGRITGNRFKGVATGIVITLVVQSSSATTVMLVGFVGAGLITLAQSIGVIMGANIGTTMTAWLVSLLGFNVKITSFALPAIGIGIAMTFLHGARKRQWGEVLLGFGMLFLGLSLLKGNVPDLEDPEQISWLTQLTGYGLLSLFAFLLAGTVLTVLLQSSSAATTLTLTLAALGWIPFEMALAMILGENIGTTITANLAAIGGTNPARRSARTHFLFNIFGVVWALILLYPVLVPLVDAIAPGDPTLNVSDLRGDEVAETKAAGIITMHLAVFHTLFNVTNTLVLLPFVRQLERIVKRWVPDEKNGHGRLRFLSSTLIETPELLIVQASREMQHMIEVVREMFGNAMYILQNPDQKLGRLVEDTLEKEEVCDELEREIVAHLTMTARAATSAKASRKVAELIQNTHRLERVADHCAVLVRIARRIHEAQQRFDDTDARDLAALGELVDQALQNVGDYLVDRADAKSAEALEARIDETRRNMRGRHIERMRESADYIDTELAFLDAITHLEEIGDRAVGIIRLAETTRRM